VVAAAAAQVNLDDYYAPQRFAAQLAAVAAGADLVSSYFVRVAEACPPAGGDGGGGGGGGGGCGDAMTVEAEQCHMDGLELLGGEPATPAAVRAQLAAEHNGP
jgi:hypothetical protein